MRITNTYAGGMRFESEVRGHRIVVDVPQDMGGNDAGPMPPELVVTALGSCVGIYAVNFCRKHNISTEGLVVHTDWEKAGDPSRIGSIAVEVDLPAGVPEDKREAFMRTIEQCMVHNTLCITPNIKLGMKE